MPIRFRTVLCLAAMLVAGSALAGKDKPYQLVDLGEGVPLRADERADVAGFQLRDKGLRDVPVRWRDGRVARTALARSSAGRETSSTRLRRGVEPGHGRRTIWRRDAR